MTRTSFGTIEAAAFMALAALCSLLAEPVGDNTPGNVKASCNLPGDVYFPPTAKNNGEYGCLRSSGGLTICGGAGAYHNTCDFYSKGPARPKGISIASMPPTRVEMSAAAKANPAIVQRTPGGVTSFSAK